MDENKSTYSVALVDDHILFRKGIAQLINGFQDFEVIMEANDGNHLIAQLKNSPPPTVVVLDINMKGVDGYETCKWLKENHSHTKVLALSMYDDERAIIKMVKLGACGYVLKDAEPHELKAALIDVVKKGFHYSDTVGKVLVNQIQQNATPAFKDREIEFLQLNCSEMTYKEIADKMCLSPRSIDGYREALFEKLGVKNRVGLVLYAIKHGIYVMQ